MSNEMSVLGRILRSIFSWLDCKRLPVTDGELKLPGLSERVDILRDKWGVPHIYASNVHDLFYAQGFVEAQDRLFQMELNRRTAQGLLSELFGSIALDTDRAVRTFGFNRLGKIDWENASVETKEKIQAYTDGVNGFLVHPRSKLPIEFSLLNHKPKPWEPLDVTAFARVMMWQLSHAWYGEMVRAQLIQAVGEEHAAELDIFYPSQNPTILPQGIEFNVLDKNAQLISSDGPFLKRNMGSNSWVVSAGKSTTGSAVLCNDMHLALGTPCIWYEVHLCGGDYHVSGVTLPGVPGVMVGHNDHIAWGMTLAFTDCEDLFVEQFDPKNPTHYKFRDEWREANIIKERIPIKGKADAHLEQVVITHHGPIISDVVGYPDQRLAVNSMALKPSLSLQAWLDLNKAQSWDEFVRAMKLVDAPQLCVSYADIQNNIGYWLTGKVPIRAKGDGSLPAEGLTGEYEWIAEVPFESMPHALNPLKGFLVLTNNRIIPDNYPYFLGNVWMNGYRARRIEDIFLSKDTLDFEDYKKLHLDFTCLPGLEFVSRLQNLEVNDAEFQLALQRLNSWNGELSPESVGGCIYSVTRYFTVRNILEPVLGEELTDKLVGMAFNPVLMTANEFYGNDTPVIFRLLDDTQSWWVNQAGGRDTLLVNSMKQAISWLRENLGGNMDEWEWGKIHRAVFPHALGLQKPLDLVFNRGPVSIGGDTDTPCQTAYRPNQPFDNNAWAPSFRQIVDMGNLANSIITTVPGQSGQVGSSHYDDFIQPWLKGEYHPMLWNREDIEKYLEGALKLLP